MMLIKLKNRKVGKTSIDFIKNLHYEGMERTVAFEEDLSHYLGQHWKKDYQVRPEVQNYLQHLR